MEENQIEPDAYKLDLSPEQMLKIIFEYTAKIANEKKLETVLVLMANLGREMVVADRCTVWLIDAARNELFTVVALDAGEIRIPYGSGLVGNAISTGQPIFIDDAYEDPRHNPDHDKQTGYRTRSIMTIPFRNNQGEVIGAYQAINKLTEKQSFSAMDMEYLSLAAAYSGKSLESTMLHAEIIETQKEIILAMGHIGEGRSKETGNHVKRVAQYSYILAIGLGMSESEADMLRSASPMHDIGKVAIPDAILQKPGKLTAEEYEQMKEHATIGYRLLRKSKRQLLQAAAIVAWQHHEKWDGTGYPQGLAGESIHIYGRITALADVFDALGSSRVYKEAWSMERILALVKEERGRHFDPRVVDVFLEQLPSILDVKVLYKDLLETE
ncbi:HD-GYP domain-containing protein (c-di-GMP phosphodiesterase class II) [Paenibacillus endophyticus]|uniref:HD-GYP domain-containing protein (C-di-GMP phosphodiesterase class II) n=1 Tax=Paenibacillus endophyticus TaxID=1294268 RepID=A0A7W5GE07_9BACL|nr:HD domain-containing phosphohydrolase [Paenibacillus endophyticus]MBB3156008.1 HD-GYP domain-containing protein (c-di-GMP phosphodiesterase class II) [Paenibacillus endophyticus]